MGNDRTNICLSREATDVANKLKEKNKFKDAMSAAKFALAYTIKNHFDEFDPEEYTKKDNDGNKYNVGSVGNDLKEIVEAIYPNTDTPYTYIESLMDYGLIKIKEKMDNEQIEDISDLCI